VSASDTAQPRPAVEDALAAAAASGRLDSERLRLVCRAVVRTPLGVLPASAFIAYIMAPHVGAARAWGWMALVLALWSARAVVCALLLRRPPLLDRVRFWIRFQIVFAWAGGIAAGSAAFLFAAAPTLETAYMTMVVCGWCAAGLAVSGAVPAAFFGLVAFFLGPFTVAWASSGRVDGPLVATLLVLFIVLLTTYARDSALLVARTLRVGFENEELARRLQARETEAQAARERAEAANVAKSSFLAAASHDLRQPLHALSLLLSALQDRTSDVQASEMLKKIATAADSLDTLFKSLLDLSRLDAGSMSSAPGPLPLAPLLARLENDFRPLAQAKGLQFACAAGEVWVSSDDEMLERILRNLLDNAIKYTERGRIDLEVDASADSVRLTVRDTGIGIEPAHRDRIFEEYYQIRNPGRDRRQGIGLGLAIVKRMCDLLQHEIVVQSEPGRGTRFAITVPRVASGTARARQAAADAGRSNEPLRGLVIVVIEDDGEVQDAMRALLGGWGCVALVCASSDEALRALAARELRPEVVLADYRLAGAENGLDAIGRLYEHYGDMPAAIVTGEINAGELTIPESMPVLVMQKPVRAAELRDWLLVWKSMS
jgi:two-component system, sensor histidine kinase